MSGVQALSNLLASIPPGEIAEVRAIELALADCWDELSGSEREGMEGYKLRRRMEKVVWIPPRLEFRIERHGRTVMGSTRADMQHWVVDLAARTATFLKQTHRQIRPMGARVQVKPIAEEFTRLIITRQENSCLRWYSDGSVRVQIGSLFPNRDSPKQTVAGRRKRFWAELSARLKEEGWLMIKHGVYAVRESVDEGMGSVMDERQDLE
jgi:hypothetical protein